ncbi:MAG TPA: tyrosine-protein phosphatase [Gemmataceae bacterium]|nr:tyrosine-protein phosphatase [Gemmataceae bacterium]
MTMVVLERNPRAAFVARLRPVQKPSRVRPRAIVRGIVAGALVCLAVQVFQFLLLDNLHSVQPGRVYRSSQLSPARLNQLIDRYHIHTIVNLRGPCPEFTWYQDESRVSHERNVSQEDIVLSAIRLPPPAEVQRLVQVLEHAQYPILLHCRQGVDRTGLAAVIVRLLEPGVSLAEARTQMSFRFGYIPYNGTENIQKFVDFYDEWLHAQQLIHSPELFRYWVNEQYCPGACRAKLELSPDRTVPDAFHAHQAATLVLRAYNQSIRPWKLRPGTWQGVHARYQITAADGEVVFQERAGLFDATVSPGDHIDLTIGIPELAPGKYTLYIDLVDADQNSFSQFGMEPIFRELNFTNQP